MRYKTPVAMVLLASLAVAGEPVSSGPKLVWELPLDQFLKSPIDSW